MVSNPDNHHPSRVSSLSSFDDAVTSFKEYGFLYESFPEIGGLVDSLGPELNAKDGFDKHVKDIIFRNLHLKRLLEPYVRNLPTFTFSLGTDPIHYFALTDDRDTGHDEGHPIAVYIWSKSTELECAAGSHTSEFTSVEWANRMFLIPYPQVKDRFNEIPFALEEGGILITHPRVAFLVKRGLSISYVWAKPHA